MASVAGFIPPSDDNDSAPFSGTTTSPHAPCSFVEGTASRQAQIQAQKRDARVRTVAWDADNFGRLDSRDLDAEGEADPDCAPERVNDSGIDLNSWVPLGVRNDDGTIIPIAERDAPISQLLTDRPGTPMNIDTIITQEVLFGGAKEGVPTCIQQLVTSFSL